MDNDLYKIIREKLNWDMDKISVEYQNDGLTNRNYVISNGGEKYAVRISVINSGELGINRHAEFSAMKAVSAIGIGPEIVYFSAETGCMITKYINGKKWENKDAGLSENILRIGETIKKVHELPAIPFKFSPYRDIEKRIQIARENNFELPDCLDRLVDTLHAIEHQREKTGEQFVGLCHNDPFPNNFIDSESLRLIDWEFAGMGDVFFDLSCLAMFYTPDQKEQLISCYFGRCDSILLSALRQMGFVVSFWNAMWAVVQTKNDAKNGFGKMAKILFSNMIETLKIES
jgi:thiamine kinase-like enzyme